MQHRIARTAAVTLAVASLFIMTNVAAQAPSRRAELRVHHWLPHRVEFTVPLDGEAGSYRPVPVGASGGWQCGYVAMRATDHSPSNYWLRCQRSGSVVEVQIQCDFSGRFSYNNHILVNAPAYLTLQNGDFHTGIELRCRNEGPIDSYFD